MIRENNFPTGGVEKATIDGKKLKEKIELFTLQNDLYFFPTIESTFYKNNSKKYTVLNDGQILWWAASKLQDKNYGSFSEETWISYKNYSFVRLTINFCKCGPKDQEYIIKLPTSNEDDNFKFKLFQDEN
jgi:hypothetical protein